MLWADCGLEEETGLHESVDSLFLTALGDAEDRLCNALGLTVLPERPLRLGHRIGLQFACKPKYSGQHPQT